MAKKKQVESSLDDMFEVSLEVAQNKYPDLVYTGGEESMTLPVPGLAPRVLLQQEGWPLSRLLDGKKESFKSSLGYEIIRWHRLQAGKGQIMPPMMVVSAEEEELLRVLKIFPFTSGLPEDAKQAAVLLWRGAGRDA